MVDLLIIFIDLIRLIKKYKWAYFEDLESELRADLVPWIEQIAKPDKMRTYSTSGNCYIRKHVLMQVFNAQKKCLLIKGRMGSYRY